MTPQELSVLSPDVTVTLSNGDEVLITPIKLGQLPKALKLASGLTELITKAIPNDKSDTKMTVEGLMVLMGDGGDKILDLLAFGVGKERAYLDGLGTDDGILLLSEFIVVNHSFFTERIKPVFVAAKEKLAAKSAPTVSSTQSSS